MLLPDLDAAQAMAVAERLRAAVESMALPLDGGGLLRVTASIGLAQSGSPRSGVPSLQQYLQVADTALYAAKAGGRNCVVAASVRA